MERIEKTVFLSYRRTNSPWALAIFQNLTLHGYDVFFDYDGIASGDFERVILENLLNLPALANCWPFVCTSGLSAQTGKR
jgi:hypothetical protein